MTALLTCRDEDRYIGGDGAISPMQDPALFGFSRTRFTGDSYLWKTGKEIKISLIESKTPGRGHFSQLVKNIEANGFTVAVPNPMARMTEILKHLGFKPGYDQDAEYSTCEVWRK